MYPQLATMFHLRGLFTSYGADLAQPAWIYITIRRRPASGVARWFGGSSEMAAGSIFLVGLASELSQYFWPHGLFHGTFDPIDILAFAIGVLICYMAERIGFSIQRESARMESPVVEMS
jgi:hypothetical protein